MVYLKVTNEDDNEFQYKTGLNIFNKSFNENHVNSGLHFSDTENIHEFYEYGVWIREVIVPRDSKIIVDSIGKYRADNIILKERHSLFKKDTYDFFNIKLSNTLYDFICGIKNTEQHGFRGHLEIVKYLYEVLKAPCGKWALKEASQSGNLEIVKYLNEVVKAPFDSRAIYSASEFGRLEVIKYLHKIAKTPYDELAMTLASSNGNLEVVKYLHEIIKAPYNEDAIFVSSKALLDEDSRVVGDHLEIIRYLLNNLRSQYDRLAINERVNRFL